MNKKCVRAVGFFLQFLILLVVGFFMFRSMMEDVMLATSIEDWKSGYIKYNNGWYVNENIVNVEKPIDIIYGPDINLPQGTYSIIVEYESDTNQKCRAYATTGEGSLIKGEVAILSRNKTEIAYKIEAFGDVKHFFVAVEYNGKGMLGIKNITIKRNSEESKRLFLNLVLLFGTLDICFWLKDYIFKNLNTVMLLGGIVIIASLPLSMDGLGMGHDLEFHLLRIEAIAEGIHFGEWNLPIRVSSMWMEGYGYPVSIYYGDLLLYIPAFFRLMGVSVVNAYKTYVFFINIGTTVISYICFKKIFRSKKIGMLTCFAYVTAGYRLTNVWTRSAVGEYTAMMFLPVIALAIVNIYTKDCYEWKSYKKNALVLAVGMTGLIETHILSTEMTIFAIALICAVLWKRTIRKNVIKVFLLAIVETLAINAYFIVPFIDYYINVPVNVNSLMSDVAIPRIQDRGAYIVQYFAFWAKAIGKSSSLMNERMSLTPGIALMSTLIFSIVILLNKKVTKEIKLFLVLSLSALYMSSNLFPWNDLAQSCQVGKLLAQVEFPWRYLGLASVFLTLLLGSVLQFLESTNMKYANTLFKYIIVACIISLCWFISSYCDNIGERNYYDIAEMNTYYLSAKNYLRFGSDESEITNEIISDNMQDVTVVARNGNKMELSCVGTEREGKIEVPIFNYKGYKVWDEYGMKYEVMDGSNNVIQFHLPPKFNGRVTIDFVPPWYWRAAELISFISILGLCISKGIGLKKQSIKFLT